MIIQYSNNTIIIPDWVLFALILVVPAWFSSRWGQKKGTLKFLMLWSFFNFAWLLSYMIFSRSPFAGFAIFHVLAFGLLFLIFCWWWKKKKILARVKNN